MARAYLSRRAALAVVTLALFFVTASLVVPSPLYPLYQARFGFSSFDVTLVFAAYVITMLVTLLVAGSLSDSWGRKPVMLIALGAAAIAMIIFMVADGFGLLVLARVFQGITFGLASGSLAAAIVELSPRPAFGALLTVVSQSVALAVGTLGAGLLVQFAPYPFQSVYLILLVVFVASGIAMIWMREPHDARHLAPRHSWKPRMAVPKAVRKPFLQLMPCMAAAMALNGFYLSLGPSLANLSLHTTSALAGGVLMTCITGPGVISGILFRNFPVKRTLVIASACMAAGLVITLAGIVTAAPVLLYAGSTVAGFGWGASAQTMFKGLSIVTPQHQRAGVLAAMFVISYTAFSVPSVVAGAAILVADFLTVVIVYLSVVLAVAVCALIWASRIVDPVAAAPAQRDISESGTTASAR